MFKKWLIPFIYGLGIAAMIVYKEPIMMRLQEEGGGESLPWFLGAAILCATVPVIPFGIIAGIMGAQYGPIWGGMINVASSTFAAVLLFLAVRVLFQEQGKRILTRYKRMERFFCSWSVTHF